MSDTSPFSASRGKVLWKYHSSQPMVAGITPTARGLVFTGDLQGNLLAFDAASGKILFQKKAGGPLEWLFMSIKA